MKKLTAFITVAGFLGLVLYDIYAWLYGGEGATISQVYLGWAMERPWLIFATGYLAGHLTWPQEVER